MKKTTKCRCGCGAEFKPSHGRKYATPKCRAAVARRKKRVKPKRFCINCKKLIPQKQNMRRPVCFACMTWWNEEEAPRRQVERNRVWAKTKRKKPKGNTHKVKPAVTALDPDAWTHKKWALQQRELRKPNGKKCVVCGKQLTGNYRLRCRSCTRLADDYLSECGESGITGVFRFAAG